MAVHDEEALERVFRIADRKLRATIEREPGFFPMYTVGGRWRHGGEAWTDWCGGFHAGMMWLLARRTGDAWWRSRAEEYSRRLEPRKLDANVHDLGFIFLNSYLPWFEETGGRPPASVLIEAARTSASRFRERGLYLPSFIGPQSLFIDIMMNVPLIFLGARLSGDEHLDRVGRLHCRTTERVLVRADGTTAHEGIFDVGTGTFLRESTHQGLRPDSAWSRGLAWSLYGFTTVFSFTRDPADLGVAERNADAFLARIGNGAVPPWDFDAPDGPERIEDTSAGAIAASGLLHLARSTGDPTRAVRYEAAARRIVGALASEQYVPDDPAWEGLLMHGVYHKPKGLGVDESVMWGDYFLLEAVARLLRVRGTVEPLGDRP